MTGAGCRRIGIPTFARRRPGCGEVPAEELASPEAFARHPSRYGSAPLRRQLIDGEPNEDTGAGSAAGSQTGTVVTQNVDVCTRKRSHAIY